jgi:hypothetical protein
VVSFPAGPARIIGVLPRLSTSFKLGVPEGDSGSMIWDGQAAITVATDRPAKMIPVTLLARDRRRGTERTYRLEVASNPALTPLLVQVSLGAILEACGGSSDDVTTAIDVAASFSGGRKLAVDDTLHVGREALFSPAPLARVLAPLENMFGRLDLESLTCSMEFAAGRRTALLRRASFPVRELSPGREAELAVVLKPYGEPETTRTVRFRVPEEAAGGELEVNVQAGSGVQPDIAPPETLDEVVTSLSVRHRASDLVVTLTLPGRGLLYRGRVLRRLPRSVVPILEAPNGTGAESTAEIARVVDRTPWVVQGGARLKVPVKEVALE